jgi:hypothetical protein
MIWLVSCGLSERRAARAYSLIRPLRADFRRICCVPALVTGARGAIRFAIGDVLAYTLAAADLGQGQPGGLGVTDKTEPGGGTGGVVTVTARGRQQARLLVEADCLGRQSGGNGDVPDTHAPRPRLDLPSRVEGLGSVVTT